MTGERLCTLEKEMLVDERKELKTWYGKLVDYATERLISYTENGEDSMRYGKSSQMTGRKEKENVDVANLQNT